MKTSPWFTAAKTGRIVIHFTVLVTLVKTDHYHLQFWGSFFASSSKTWFILYIGKCGNKKALQKVLVCGSWRGNTFAFSRVVHKKEKGNLDYTNVTNVCTFGSVMHSTVGTFSIKVSLCYLESQTPGSSTIDTHFLNRQFP